MIIVPDDPGEASPLECFKAKVVTVFEGDGFLADVWNPKRNAWVPGLPFRFAFIDAPEMGQPGGEEAKDFLARLIAGKTLRLDPIGKESSGYMPFYSYKRILCMGYLTEQLPVGPVAYYLDGECKAGTARRPRPVCRNIELEMIVNGPGSSSNTRSIAKTSMRLRRTMLDETEGPFGHRTTPSRRGASTAASDGGNKTQTAKGA